MLASPFAYPLTPLIRIHGPRGYANYQEFKPWLRDEFQFRCVYCLIRERWFPDGFASFSIDHIVPRSIEPQRTCDYENLAYACSRCNSWKQDHPVMDPGDRAFGDHVRVDYSGRAAGITNEGDLLIDLLGLNDPSRLKFRTKLIELIAILSSLPQAQEQLLHWLGFPDDLPDLSIRRPPDGNSRPDGISRTHYARRERGELPATY